jgi:hypothetical protein
MVQESGSLDVMERQLNQSETSRAGSSFAAGSQRCNPEPLFSFEILLRWCSIVRGLSVALENLRRVAMLEINFFHSSGDLVSK